MSNLLQILTQIGLQTFTTIALISLISLFSKKENKKLLFIYVLFFIATTVAYFIPRSPIFESFRMNWQGQSLVILLSLSFVFSTKYLSLQQAGFTFKVNKSVWFPLAILTILGLLFNVFVRRFDFINSTSENIIYQLTMPSVAEEMAFRGVLLGLLNKVFIERRTIFGAQLGWGAIILSFAFGLGHSVYFIYNQHIQFAFDAFLVTTTLAFFMTYLKEKGESIVPAIIFHSIYNASLPIIKLF